MQLLSFKAYAEKIMTHEKKKIPDKQLNAEASTYLIVYEVLFPNTGLTALHTVTIESSHSHDDVGVFVLFFAFNL